MLSEDQEFLALQKRIFKEKGLGLSQYREKCLKRRVNMRLRATGANTYPEYLGDQTPRNNERRKVRKGIMHYFKDTVNDYDRRGRNIYKRDRRGRY